MKTLKELMWILTAGKPTPSCKAATVLYLHGVRISASIRLKVSDADLSATSAMVMIDGSRPVYITYELTNILRGLTAGKADEDLLLGYLSVPEFHADFRRMVRTSKVVRFDLSDIKEMFRRASGIDYPLLKQYESAQPFSLEDVKKAWLRVLPRLVVGV